MTYCNQLNMRNFITGLALGLSSLAPSASVANTLLPEIVISADLVPVEAKRAGSAVTVVDAEAIEETKPNNLAEILRGLPGVSLNQAGGKGSLTEIRMRGSEANHVLVFVDGIEVNRPGEGGFDFSAILAEDIERVEVVRGPQSGLYGSNAVAGAITIITKSGRDTDGYAGYVKAEAGTRSSGAGAASIRGGNGTVWGALNVSGFTTEGHNTARAGNEDDGADNFAALAKAGAQLTDQLSVDGVLRYSDRRVESDRQNFTCLGANPFAFPCLTPSFGYGQIVDSNDVQDTTDLSGRITAKLDTFDGVWSHEITAAFNRIDTEFIAEVDPASNNSGTKETRDTFSYKTVARHIGPSGIAGHTVTGLVEYQRETFRNTHAFATPAQRIEKSRRTLSFAGEYLLELFDALSLTAAFRHDDNDRFVDANTWRLTGAFLLPNGKTRLHASTGTGVANPTFFELFGFFPSFFVGNPNLTPEYSRGYDFGIEHQFLEGDLVVDVTWFSADLTNEITTNFGVFPATAINLAGQSKREGLEVAASWQALPWLALSGAYNYLESTQPNGTRELRRPRHTAKLNATATFDEGRGKVTAGLQFNGDMLDTAFGPTGNTVVRVDDFVVVNAAVSYMVKEDFEVYLRAENLFDEKYEEIVSYRAPGATFYGGVVFKFGSDS